MKRTSPAPETARAYQRRLRRNVRGRDFRAVLRSTPDLLARRIAGAPRHALTAPPAPGKWSAAQILAHLADMELLWGYRIRTIVEKDGVPMAGIDQDAWASSARYERTDPRRSLETFRVLRRANLDLFDRLSDRERRRRGMHSQFGPLTLSRIFLLLAGHDVNHSRQIAAILGSRSGAGRRKERHGKP